MEKKYVTNRDIAQGASKVPERVYPPRIENGFAKGVEVKRQIFDVSNIDLSMLRELSDFLQKEKINLNQKALKQGEVSAGYLKKGITIIDENLFGVVINDTNYIIKGTREEFLSALAKVNHPL